MKSRLIVFTGPDGSGKTTLVEATRQMLKKKQIPNRVAKLGIYNQRTQLLKTVRKVSGNPKKFPAPKFIKTLFRFIDMWLRYFKIIPARIKGKTIICDRYFYDLEFYSDDFLAKVLSRIAPRPDKAFLVFVDPEELWSRKGEYSEEKLKKHLSTMKSLRKKFKLVEIENYDLKRSKKIIASNLEFFEK